MTILISALISCAFFSAYLNAGPTFKADYAAIDYQRKVAQGNNMTLNIPAYYSGVEYWVYDGYEKNNVLAHPNINYGARI